MKIIGVLGSPRENSNTDILLAQALKGAKAAGVKIEKICLGRLKFSPCIECGGCDKTGVCVLKDDLTPLYKKIEGADAVIIASPIFFGSLSAQTKAFIDRFQSVWVGKYILKNVKQKNKEGAFLSVSGSGRADFFNNARSIARNFFAVIGAEYSGEILSPAVDKKAGIKKFKSVLEKAYRIGNKIAREK